MGKVLDFKNIDNWEEIFDMIRELLTFLIDEDKIKPELIIKNTYDILESTGYGYNIEDIRKKYYELL